MTSFKQQAILALKEFKSEIEPTTYRLLKRSITSNKPAYHQNEKITVTITPSGERRAEITINKHDKKTRIVTEKE